jgi:hypothetical protein
MATTNGTRLQIFSTLPTCVEVATGNKHAALGLGHADHTLVTGLVLKHSAEAITEAIAKAIAKAIAIVNYLDLGPADAVVVLAARRDELDGAPGDLVHSSLLAKIPWKLTIGKRVVPRGHHAHAKTGPLPDALKYHGIVVHIFL